MAAEDVACELWLVADMAHDNKMAHEETDHTVWSLFSFEGWFYVNTVLPEDVPEFSIMNNIDCYTFTFAEH